MKKAQTKRRAPLSRKKAPAASTATDNAAVLNVSVADLTVGTFLKAVADTVVSANASQSNQIAGQIAQQVDQTIGKLSSDLAGRTIIQSDVDVDNLERFRATAGRDHDAWAYKTNVTDFVIGTNAAANQGTMQTQVQRMVEASLNHYATTLADERVSKAHIGFYKKSKLAQELAHADIAREDQWESDKEALVSAIVGEVVKSIQVPPAATEGVASRRRK